MDKQKRKTFNEKIKDFIFSQTSELVTRASMGWIYSLSYDKAFLIENLGLKETYKTNLKKKNKYLKQKNSKMDFDIFDQLQRLDTIQEKWNYMKKINSLGNFAVFKDSFGKEKDEIAIQLGRKFLSSNEKLNVLVMGAGCCGLFFANNLKKKTW